MKVTAPGAPAAHSLHEVCEAARRANCGECWALPGDECVCTSIAVSVPVTPGTPVQPARGYHVARFGRAMRRGLISGADLIAVLRELDAFTNSTIVYDVPGQSGKDERRSGAAGGQSGDAGHSGLSRLLVTSPCPPGWER